MQKTQKRSAFNPHHRYENAMRRILSSRSSASGDVWEDKLYNMLWLREQFKEEYGDDYYKYFEDRYPLYSALLSAAEDTRIGGDKDTLEAMLLCGIDTAKVADCLEHPRFDSLFLCTYRKLFYDIVPALTNQAVTFQCIIAPMTRADTDKLAVGHIWKLLALAGGAPLLRKKGFGTDPIKGGDIEYLLQLACYRHCSSLLQYSAAGRKFFADNPAAAAALTTLMDFDTIRSNGRRADYIGELEQVIKNNYNNLLSCELKLLSVSDAELAKLAEYDGQFRPDLSNMIEYNKHITFNDEDDNE